MQSGSSASSASASRVAATPTGSMPASVPASTPSFSLAVHPHARPAPGRGGGRSARIANLPTPPVDQPTTRYVIGSPQSSCSAGSGGRPRPTVGDRRPLDLVGADAQRGMEPLHRLVGEPLGQRSAEPAGRGERRRPERRPRRRARCAAAARWRRTLLIAPSTSGGVARVLQREHPLDLSGRREPPGHERPRARRGAPGRRVPAQWSSSASRLRVAQPSQAAPDCARRAARR